MCPPDKGVSPPPAESIVMSDQADTNRKLVLLVEDSIVNQKLLTLMLEHE